MTSFLEITLETSDRRRDQSTESRLVTSKVIKQDQAKSLYSKFILTVPMCEVRTGTGALAKPAIQLGSTHHWELLEDCSDRI